ncbi:SDR family NAD(P)-dependent oxidoreductase [Novosphingobium sp. JCM 18896]|uniref:SDR family NAD(P)-dependent oxidoreductase n=1 Tax=Novosphingobium sp. JCM 18896 TaxID=2989731 RepID=UPI00222186D0|nr:SDR family NAD(P)-dependent oxidoreductase [Novosphingobium sp. JCM 18896]MCW1428324.1 SDR family NAD(P)-dependent oxidoreductase [Novosphingobium sp. JCM 18896]
MKIDSSIAAVVTGGASGLGLATVKALREAGVRVAIFDLNPEAGEKAAAETGALFCQADVLSDDSLDAAFAKARAAHGQERVLVSCAGGGNAKTTVSQDRETGAMKLFPTAEFARVVNLNAVGTFATITRFAAGCATLDPIDGERGAIVCTASVAAQDGQMGQAAYAAGKAAIAGMTLPIARDLSRFGIRVNTILPGIFSTPLMNQAPQALKDRLSAMTAYPNRFGEPHEYASLALELCRNTYMNAQAIRLDAGVRFAAK